MNIENMTYYIGISVK